MFFHFWKCFVILTGEAINNNIILSRYEACAYYTINFVRTILLCRENLWIWLWFTFALPEYLVVFNILNLIIYPYISTYLYQYTMHIVEPVRLIMLMFIILRIFLIYGYPFLNVHCRDNWIFLDMTYMRTKQI